MLQCVSECVSYRKSDQVSPKISRRINVLCSYASDTKSRVFMVAVIIPGRFASPLLRERVLESSIWMQPLGVERTGYLVGDQRLGIKAQLGAAGTRKVGAQVDGELVNRLIGEVKKTVVRIVRIRRELLYES